jgi:DHA1 family multidrug resistance protein-like MFS transporter
MFQALGVNWAGTLLGCVAMALVPIPILFYIYGAKIRERSAFAPSRPFGVEQPVVEDEADAEKVPTRRTAADDQV